jgi:glycosyltransferase involved in cell wall biosynthesis
MKVLITGPSLDSSKNISGISSVVSNILSSTELDYIHFVVGKQDGQSRNLAWLVDQIILPFKLFKVFLFNKIDIFHLNAPLDYLAIVRDFVFLLTARLFRSKIILHLHGGQYMTNPPKNKILWAYLHFYFTLADQIIVLSSHEKNILIQEYEMATANISALENCVFVPEIPTTRVNTLIRIIFLGRIVERKGIRNIVEALKQLQKVRTDFEFYLYGTGPETSYTTEELSLHLGNQFKYIGVVAGEARSVAYSQADIFLLPSHSGEGLPVALLESMSYGVIPVVTNDGSMATVVENETNGFLVEKNNTGQIFQLLNHLLDLIPTVRGKELRLNAIETIKKKFDSRHYNARLERIYHA